MSLQLCLERHFSQSNNNVDQSNLLHDLVFPTTLNSHLRANKQRTFLQTRCPLFDVGSSILVQFLPLADKTHRACQFETAGFVAVQPLKSTTVTVQCSNSFLDLISLKTTSSHLPIVYCGQAILLNSYISLGHCRIFPLQKSE